MEDWMGTVAILPARRVDIGNNGNDSSVFTTGQLLILIEEGVWTKVPRGRKS